MCIIHTFSPAIGQSSLTPLIVRTPTIHVNQHPVAEYRSAACMDDGATATFPATPAERFRKDTLTLPSSILEESCPPW